jgi:hypothetical protein
MVTLENTAYFSVRSAAHRAGCGAQSTQNPVAAENAQIAPHLALGVTVRGKQMLLVGQVADVGGNLPLQIFSPSGPVIVASAQSSSVISVNGRRAEEKADAEEKV